MSQSWKDGKEKISSELRTQLQVAMGNLQLLKVKNNVDNLIIRYNLKKALENINDIADLKELDKLPEMGKIDSPHCACGNDVTVVKRYRIRNRQREMYYLCGNCLKKESK